MPFNARLWQLDSPQSQQSIHISAHQKKELISLKKYKFDTTFHSLFMGVLCSYVRESVSANESIHINISRCINAPAANNSERDINHE
jgi:hypothetical protein